MRRAGFITVKILPPEAPGLTAEASGGDILTSAKATASLLCRPACRIALWRRIGNLSVLNRMRAA